MKKLAGFFLILATIGSMVSCRPAGTSMPSLPAVTATVETTRPTATPATATSPARPTSTVLPTETPETPSATPEIVATLLAISTPGIHSTLLSPDGKWRAEVVIYDCVPVDRVEHAYEQLRLVPVGGSDTKIAGSQLRLCEGLGAFGLAGLFWSANSRYFYYTDAREGGPDGCGYWKPPILRLDVSSLRSDYLGGGSRSPDGSKLATWRGQELVISDVERGEIARLPAIASNAVAGPIAWSPDSQALAYVQFASYCELSGKSYVARLDLPGLSQTPLLESESPSFRDVIWENLSELRLFDENGKEWRYSFTTQELSQAP